MLVLHEDVWSAPVYLQDGTASTIDACHPRVHPGKTPTRSPEPRGPTRIGRCPNLAHGRRRTVASSASNAAAIPVPSVLQAGKRNPRAGTEHESRTLADTVRSSDAALCTCSQVHGPPSVLCSAPVVRLGHSGPESSARDDYRSYRRSDLRGDRSVSLADRQPVGCPRFGMTARVFKIMRSSFDLSDRAWEVPMNFLLSRCNGYLVGGATSLMSSVAWRVKSVVRRSRLARPTDRVRWKPSTYAVAPSLASLGCGVAGCWTIPSESQVFSLLSRGAKPTIV